MYISQGLTRSIEHVGSYANTNISAIPFPLKTPHWYSKTTGYKLQGFINNLQGTDLHIKTTTQ